MKNIISPLLTLLSSSFQSPTMRREFRFVPYGETWNPDKNGDDRPTISCDGRIPGGGVTLELSHWTDNETPDALYADSSTEMALKLAQQQQQQQVDDASLLSFSPQQQSLDEALILNNHYDTDGVLACWACLYPQEALQFWDLLRQGAEAGDFGEWPSDDGVKLNAIVENLCQDDEAAAYKNILPQLLHILRDLAQNQGNEYRALWEQDLDRARQSFTEFCNGKITLTPGPGSIVLVKESSSGQRPMDSHALHRALMESDLWPHGSTRILRFDPENGLYRYHKVGHGWVRRLVDRPVVPVVADAERVVHELNAVMSDDDEVWAKGGPGLTAICQSRRPVRRDPEEVLQLLHAVDPGSH